MKEEEEEEDNADDDDDEGEEGEAEDVAERRIRETFSFDIVGMGFEECREWRGLR